MTIQQIQLTFLITAVTVNLTITLPATADPDQWLKRSEENLQLVISNMTEDFHAFGICGQQAKMLAEQTADFGIGGIMTTIAAVGIGPLVVNMLGTRTKPCPIEA